MIVEAIVAGALLTWQALPQIIPVALPIIKHLRSCEEFTITLPPQDGHQRQGVYEVCPGKKEAVLKVERIVDMPLTISKEQQ